MKAVILAGGYGTRISEETLVKPKPLVEIGGKPILWHIMKIYSSYGINDFVICLGYKGYLIKEFFANYYLHMSDVSFDLATNEVTAVQPPGRFGALEIEGERLLRFREKPQGDGSWVNGGYFVIDPKALDSVPDDATPWESEPLESLAEAGLVGVYRHPGFFHPMDTLRDKAALEEMWLEGNAPWRIWS